LTTNVSGHVEKNLLVKHLNFSADSERASKVVLEFFVGAESKQALEATKNVVKNDQLLKWSKFLFIDLKMV
jgi:hypothetical protein